MSYRSFDPRAPISLKDAVQYLQSPDRWVITGGAGASHATAYEFISIESVWFDSDGAHISVIDRGWSDYL